MNLINLDGLALIGQGSEWFWSMLQFVIVTVTLYAIYRQVRLQASAAAIEQASQLQEEWHSSERLMRSRLATMIALRDGKDVATTARSAASDVGNFWERVGYLVKAGHIDERLVYDYFGNSVQLWWAWLMTTVNHWRSAEAEPGIQEHFEWLAKRVAEMDLAKGIASAYDPASTTARLSGHISANVEAIHTQEQIRSVIIQSEHTKLPTPG